MKKRLLFLICIILLLCLVGCKPGEPIIMLEYKGTPLSSLSYKSVDYMGGMWSTTTFDFEKNSVTVTKYNPYAAEQGEEEYTTTHLCDFTEEAEREFINKVYSFGLFNIKDRYEPRYPVADGGGWTLEINYADGSVKRSSGSNARPSTVFDNCAIPFYDLCGSGVVGAVPGSYYSPPRIDLALGYEYKNHIYSFNGNIDVNRGNYLWNEHTSGEVDLYELTTAKNDPSLLRSGEYSLSLYTSNYSRPGDGYSRFEKCVVMSYAIDPALTDGREVLSRGWFDQISIPLEFDRIYVVTLYFSNGDYVEYAFSTAALDQKIQYGEYHYNVYNEGRSVLDVNADGTFTLDPFDYFEEKDRKPGEAKESLSGSWGFENIDGAEYLVLTSASGDRIVFDYSAVGLYLDFELSTLDLTKYNLDGNPEYSNGQVDFKKH